MSEGFPNNAPRRKHPVDKAQFDALRGALCFGFNRAGGINDDMLAAWERHIPLAPRTAVRILTRDLPRGTGTGFTLLHKDGAGELEIIRWDRHQYEPLMKDSRTFDLAEGCVNQGDVFVAPHVQGRGYGRTMMRNQVEFFHACGARLFDIHAASENGGYTWARLGFLPQFTGSDSFRASVKRPVLTHLETLEPVLGRKTAEKIESLLEFRKPTDMWELADMREDVLPKLTPVFNRTARGPRLSVAQRQDLHDMYRAAYQEAAKKGRGMPLGRLLLTGTAWKGRLHMDDRAQMTRVGQYCGGWKYIAL
jgi:GNAT superfamily N-acetyltransferase